MKNYYAIVVQRAVVAGKPTGSIDVSAYYFLAESKENVRAAIHSQHPFSYEGAEGDEVIWELLRILSIDERSELISGDEVTGFITSVDELSGFVEDPDDCRDVT
ncbi:hypothetical protein [Botrimarina mediterranea]|uniref:DUF4288 domain-containing protein n=1 Tax=Botrimarina mediterranea TaxID=2528022 RepID=A0A518KDM9_9BACT|nr:hypothetical protein [Botrimarina mediterranea]QDV75897.1 hypothetical protein Spa11_41200 [Botrimarina mediterranea]QDV80492.1 hypothetical protein K2D_41210 [Planctomycetes bacterium K2D]